jgi:hypothetical protein
MCVPCLKTFLESAFTAIIQEIFIIRNMEIPYRITFGQYCEWSGSNIYSLSRKHFTESDVEWNLTMMQNLRAIGLAPPPQIGKPAVSLVELLAIFFSLLPLPNNIVIGDSFDVVRALLRSLVKVSLKVSLFMFSSSEHFQSVSDHM